MKKKNKNRKTNKGKKYSKRISLYPLKPEKALELFMKVDPKRI